MKALILIFLMMNFTTGFANERGNGGSGSQVQLASELRNFQLKLLEIAHFFTENEMKLSQDFYEIKDFKKFLNVMGSVELSITNKVIYDNRNDVRSCINDDKKFIITCNYTELRKLQNNQKAYYVLVLHEILSLMHIEETGPIEAEDIEGYEVSHKLSDYIYESQKFQLMINPPSVASEEKELKSQDTYHNPEKDGKGVYATPTVGVFYNILEKSESYGATVGIKGHLRAGNYQGINTSLNLDIGSYKQGDEKSNYLGLRVASSLALPLSYNSRAGYVALRPFGLMVESYQEKGVRKFEPSYYMELEAAKNLENGSFIKAISAKVGAKVSGNRDGSNKGMLVGIGVDWK